MEDFSTEHLISDESIPTRIYSAKDMMETTIKNLNMFRELYLKTRDRNILVADDSASSEQL